MDIVRLRIPYRFICGRMLLSWVDIYFGLVNELLDPQAPVAFAVDQIGKFEESPAALLDLARLGEGEPNMALVERLAKSEPRRPEDEIRRKWLYLVLAWIYEHRHEYSDPLQRVEEVYADFGYPEQIASFVRYMPMVGPDLCNQEANERRLFERWKQYIDEFGRDCSP